MVKRFYKELTGEEYVLTEDIVNTEKNKKIKSITINVPFPFTSRTYENVLKIDEDFKNRCLSIEHMEGDEMKMVRIFMDRIGEYEITYENSQ